MTLEISLINSSQVTLVDDIDYAFLSQWRWRLMSTSTRYRYVARSRKLASGKWRKQFMHRDILNPPEGFLVDHINYDGLDNRRANLRLATPSENSVHSRRQPPNISGYRGVRFRKGYSTFFAAIRVNKKEHYLGSFDDAIDAALAYDRAAFELHGEFAVLNFP